MEKPNWMTQGIDQNSLNKSASAGDIFPRLELPDLADDAKLTTKAQNKVVTFDAEPKPISWTDDKDQKKEAWVSIVWHDGSKHSLFLPKSLRFSLATEAQKNGFTDLSGKMFIIGAKRAETSFGANTKLYWSQYVKDPKFVEGAGEAEESAPATQQRLDDARSVGGLPQKFPTDGLTEKLQNLKAHLKSPEDRNFWLAELHNLGANDPGKAFEQLQMEGIIFQPEPGKWKFV